MDDALIYGDVCRKLQKGTQAQTRHLAGRISENFSVRDEPDKEGIKVKACLPEG